jgi:glyoxylase-like metal-dependent hydrolase (beta-lactamase superfamily II)
MVFVSSALFAQFDYNLKVTKVTDGVYCFFGSVDSPNKKNGGNMVNTCYVDDGEYYSLIDSGPTYNYASQAYKIMQDIKKLPVKYVFNTHTHDDHIYGNDFYKQKGATIIASSHLHEQNDPTRMPSHITKEQFKNSKMVLNDVGVEYEESKKFGSITAMSLSDQGHSKSDMVYLDTKHKVLFTGDIAMTERIVSMRDGNINGLIEAVEKLSSFDRKFVVLGHGHDTSANAFADTLKYLKTMRDIISQAFEDEVGLDGIGKLTKMKEYKDYFGYDSMHGKNVIGVYQTLEWEQ